MIRRVMICAFALIFIVAGQTQFADAAETFEDLNSVKWAEKEIYYLSDRSIINGYSDTKFGPHDKVTREQAAAMIVREHYPNEKYTNMEYSDVSKDNPFYNDIAVATKNGILSGYPDQTFKPKKYLTRAEAAKILASTYHPTTKNTAAYFQDLNKAPWAEDKINTLALSGIITGYENGTFNPNKSVTRAEFAVLLARALHEPFQVEAHNATERKVIQLVNDERTKRGLNPLKELTTVGHVAGIKSMDMLYDGYFAHESPDYGSPFQMMTDFGVGYRGAGENIAAGYRSPEEVMEGWMNSSGHKANILNASYTHIGVGLAKGGSYNYYWTQMFVSK